VYLADLTGRTRLAVSQIVKPVETARLTEGDATRLYHPETVDLAAMLRDVCRQQRDIAPCARILEAYPPGTLPVTGDPQLLLQAFGNLLANAIKYSPTRSQVSVRMQQAGGVARVTVEDHGIGIPDQDLDRIFTGYYRESNVSGFVGTGVVLFLFTTVVHLHTGDVTVECQAGKGSRFMMTLPTAQASPPPSDEGPGVIAMRPLVELPFDSHRPSQQSHYLLHRTFKDNISLTDDGVAS